jgi:hypothetical protein
MDIQRKAFESSNNVNPDWSFKFDEELQQYIALDSEMELQVDELNEHWDTFRAGWQAAKAQAVPQWISTSDRMPEEGEEVLVHSLGQVRQVTRDSKWAGGFKERNCYGWQAAYGQSHWMPKSIELPEQYHFYYENDAKQKAMIDEVSQ